MPIFCNNVINISTDKKHKWAWNKGRGWIITANVVANTVSNTVSNTVAANTTPAAKKPSGYLQDQLSD